MDTVDPIRILLAFLFVLGLIGLCAFAAKRFLARAGFVPIPTNGGRMVLVELKMIDAKRKLVMIRVDETEHVILLAPERELLIQSAPVKNNA